MLLNLPIKYDDATFKQRRLAREQYTNEQDGLCWACGQPLNKSPTGDITKLPINESLFPIGFFRWSVHLHHDHNTGMTIGAVHSLCNAILYQYKGE
jgi:hypothetical protein